MIGSPSSKLAMFFLGNWLYNMGVMIAGGVAWISKSNCSVANPLSEGQQGNPTFHRDIK